MSSNIGRRRGGAVPFPSMTISFYTCTHRHGCGRISMFVAVAGRRRHTNCKSNSTSLLLLLLSYSRRRCRRRCCFIPRTIQDFDWGIGRVEGIDKRTNERGGSDRVGRCWIFNEFSTSSCLSDFFVPSARLQMQNQTKKRLSKMYLQLGSTSPLFFTP